MALLLVPYNNAMRLGQGFNSYTQETCVDNAVVGITSKEDSQPITPVPELTVANPGLLPVGTVAPTTVPKDTGIITKLEETAVKQAYPSQIVTYTSKYVKKLSDVANSMNVSGSLSIKYGELSGSGSGSYVDTDTFQDSDMNFMVKVTVINQTINVKDQLDFYPLKQHTKKRPDSDAKFTKTYGDSFISGFQEGGSFNAIVSIKALDSKKKTAIAAAAHVALQIGVGSVEANADVKLNKEKLNADSEVNITVNWSGGGQLKEGVEKWDIDTLMEVAARFPELVARCPQRTHAILTKYTALRRYLEWAAGEVTPLVYEIAQLYTDDLLDVYMGFKVLWKDIHTLLVELEDKSIHLVKAKEGEDEIRMPPTYDEKTKIATPGDVIKAFDPTYQGLDQALVICRELMGRLVDEVTKLEEMPSIARDIKRPMPYIRSQIFRTLLPVHAKVEALRSQTEIGRFTFRNKKENSGSTRVNYLNPKSKPAQLLWTISHMEWARLASQQGKATVDTSDLTGFNLSFALDLTNGPLLGGATPTPLALQNSLQAASINWMSLPDVLVDNTLLVGEATLVPDANNDGTKAITKRVTQSLANANFAESPVVLSFISSFQFNNSGDWSCSVASSPTDKSAFDLYFNTYGSTKISPQGFLTTRWLAFPRGRLGMDGGKVALPGYDKIGDSSLGPQAVSSQTGKVQFAPKRFTKAPSVFVGFSAFDMRNCPTIRLDIAVKNGTDDVTIDGFSWTVSTWGAGEDLAYWRTAAFSWFAIEDCAVQADKEG